MLTAEARTEIERRISGDLISQDDAGAINALLCAAFYLRGLKPVTEHGKHTFDGSAREWDERPGQMRGLHGWLTAPPYTSSLNDACDLVEHALGSGWITETMVRADGSQARLHEFDTSRSTGWHNGGPGRKGAATAIVKAVLEATQ